MFGRNVCFFVCLCAFVVLSNEPISTRFLLADAHLSTNNIRNIISRYLINVKTYADLNKHLIFIIIIINMNLIHL
jgi:hypothetical protein